MPDVTLALVSRDGFFCKDGRGWFTSASGRLRGLPWPLPQTLLGTLRTAWGRWLEVTTPRGPLTPDEWVAVTRDVRLGASVVARRAPGGTWCRTSRVWPVPADCLFVEGGGSLRLSPTPLPRNVGVLSTCDDPGRASLWMSRSPTREKPARAPRGFAEADLAQWVGESPPRNADQIERDVPSPATRVDVHLAIDPLRGTGEDGMLFSTEVVEALTATTDGSGDGPSEWATILAAWLPGGDEHWGEEIFQIGADGRLARGEVMQSDLLAPPAGFEDAWSRGSAGLRLLAVTPLQFRAGWLPDGFAWDASRGVIGGHLPGVEGAILLRGACVGRPQPMSGWDMRARAPKLTRRLVPAGSVFFFEKARAGEPFTAQEARGLWLASLGEDQDQGLGSVVPGRWTPGSSTT